ncbi:hypothetical protein Sme01_03300 [Sphaerisporangium melleum]|uniref:Uncharacterized protein n=1 Tax=Sphaerisporangium melleum TaxID=321316 RepID=A0A917VBI1_9ACTN|nr:hypothetical protein [Sphaerisporangium melleum]GGK61548.1 hypothetical protein GCM10007964_00840 [Sphaerisporangium melleum]GII67854.1 hypothetical protein Sme01_03300 [Sphaerisporangium melleum]
MTFPDMLGYAVIESDGNGGYPSFCVHGPDPVDTDYARAYDQWRLLAESRPNRRYSICKLVPVEPVQPEGDPEDRLPFDWARIDQKVAAGQITDPVWIDLHMASSAVRARLGISGTMADAREVPHPFTAAGGEPFNKIEKLSQYCAACGEIRPLIAHKESFARYQISARAEG